METLNLIVAGTGGQGIVLLSRVLGESSIEAKLKVRIGEIHGVSQRGGSVLSFIRLGPSVYSSTVPIGTANILIGLEPTEALRSLHYMSPHGFVLLNSRPVLPNSVKTGDFKYPEIEEIVSVIKSVVKNVAYTDATQNAINAGSASVMNIFMIGALVGFKYLPLSKSTVMEVIKRLIPEKSLKTNLKAFSSGIEFANIQMKKGK